MSKWKWFGFPGHFIGAHDCAFRMCTQVGDFLVSTVGSYRPDRGKEKDIGWKRKYETFVFKAGAVCTVKGCGCGMPEIDGGEIDSEPANNPGDATANHYAMCAKYARKRKAS
jgi:hypothetical protein